MCDDHQMSNDLGLTDRNHACTSGASGHADARSDVTNHVDVTAIREH